MSRCISNLEIESILQNLKNDDINENLLVFFLPTKLINLSIFTRL